MTVWIIVAVLNIGPTTIYQADGSKFAFLYKSACDQAIGNNKKLKCIELKLLQ